MLGIELSLFMLFILNKIHTSDLNQVNYSYKITDLNSQIKTKFNNSVL